ncbi:unnamed protein product, partial [Mesorhabditis belari]|uniref:PUM-HD domain-containing protein n=1 Tax=Mesorhabditis belari TaxID=2138241 RepID=A0AAF3FCL1_9BILA
MPTLEEYISAWSPFSSGIFPASLSPQNQFQHGVQMVQINNNSLSRPRQNASCESIRTGASKSESDNAILHSTLPPHAYDKERREVAITLEQVVHDGLLGQFAQEKTGCKFLQENFPEAGRLKDEIYHFAMANPGYFQTLSKDVFGNFFAQALVHHADTPDRVNWILRTIVHSMSDMCLNRYSCRVVQKTFERFPVEEKRLLLGEFGRLDMVKLSIDQNANHVVQKIIEFFDVPTWKFIIDSFVQSDESFFHVIESKYGCRVLQLIVEMVAKAMPQLSLASAPAVERINELMDIIALNCERLASNEYANYVVQHIISTPKLEAYRDGIIQNCLLRNLLSFSQEKFASHVVEKALTFAPPSLLYAMLEELFDGYLPDPTTKRECLDILLFHQYGNYVVQRMLLICIGLLQQAERGHNIGHLNQISKWTHRLENLIDTNAQRLTRYSSGKKLLEVLEQERHRKK